MPGARGTPAPQRGRVRGTQRRATQNPGVDDCEEECTAAEAKRDRPEPFPGLGTWLEHGLACELKPLCLSFPINSYHPPIPKGCKDWFCCLNKLCCLNTH